MPEPKPLPKNLKGIKPWDSKNKSFKIGITGINDPIVNSKLNCDTRYWPIFVFYQNGKGHKSFNQEKAYISVTYYRGGSKLGDTQYIYYKKSSETDDYGNTVKTMNLADNDYKFRINMLPNTTIKLKIKDYNNSCTTNSSSREYLQITWNDWFEYNLVRKQQTFQLWATGRYNYGGAFKKCYGTEDIVLCKRFISKDDGYTSSGKEGTDYSETMYDEEVSHGNNDKYAISVTDSNLVDANLDVWPASCPTSNSEKLSDWCQLKNYEPTGCKQNFSYLENDDDNIMTCSTKNSVKNLNTYQCRQYCGGPSGAGRCRDSIKELCKNVKYTDLTDPMALVTQRITMLQREMCPCFLNSSEYTKFYQPLIDQGIFTNATVTGLAGQCFFPACSADATFLEQTPSSRQCPNITSCTNIINNDGTITGDLNTINACKQQIGNRQEYKNDPDNDDPPTPSSAPAPAPAPAPHPPPDDDFSMWLWIGGGSILFLVIIYAAIYMRSRRR